MKIDITSYLPILLNKDKYLIFYPNYWNVAPNFDANVYEWARFDGKTLNT